MTPGLCDNIKEFTFHYTPSLRKVDDPIPLPNSLCNLQAFSFTSETISPTAYVTIFKQPIILTASLMKLHLSRGGHDFPDVTLGRTIPSRISALGLSGFLFELPQLIHWNLISLDLGIIRMANDNNSVNYLDALWTALSIEQIHLRSLIVPTDVQITQPLLAYLGSYSGLHVLHLPRLTGSLLSGASCFYNDVLPMHENTLVVLKDGGWCLGNGIGVAQRYWRLGRLRKLWVAVDPTTNTVYQVLAWGLSFDHSYSSLVCHLKFFITMFCLTYC